MTDLDDDMTELFALANDPSFNDEVERQKARLDALLGDEWQRCAAPPPQLTGWQFTCELTKLILFPSRTAA